MGYELKMFVVSKHNRVASGYLVQVGNDIFSAYDTKTKTGKKTGEKHYYLADGNTKRTVPSDAVVIPEQSWCQVIGMIDLCK
jgi:hypothetical protein